VQLVTLTGRKVGEDRKLVGKPILKRDLDVGIVNADNKFIQLPTCYSSDFCAHTVRNTSRGIRNSQTR
jgi:hypothetical protein